MPYTLANTERGTIAIPCPQCNALLETSLAEFVPQNDYRLGMRCPRCQAGFTVRVEPEQESQPTPVAADWAYCPHCKEALIAENYCLHCERDVTPNR